jgi:DNA polymerase-3 subunit epsilon
MGASRVSIDFVALDFETANEKRASVCAVGLVLFKDGKAVDELTWLVSPPEHLRYFNPYNVQIHGITSDVVAGKPEFKEIWPEIRAIMSHQIVVAHNASFDMSVLRQLLELYYLEYPVIRFICTCCVARKTWAGQMNYTLKTLANNLGYLISHHDPLDDARTCGKILVHACEHHGCSSLSELASTIDMQIGELCEAYYWPCSISDGYKGTRKSGPERIAMEELKYDSLVSDAFYGKNVVFTGTLVSMTRQTAAQKVVERGGSVSNSVRKDTNVLVMGLQDYERFTDGKASNKTKTARALIEQGKPLEIIDESEFLRRLLQEG